MTPVWTLFNLHFFLANVQFLVRIFFVDFLLTFCQLKKTKALLSEKSKISKNLYILGTVFLCGFATLNMQFLCDLKNCEICDQKGKIMALYLHSSRDRAQNANFLQRPRNLTHFVPPKSRPPPFSFR